MRIILKLAPLISAIVFMVSSSVGAEEILSEDLSVRDLKFVDGMSRYARTVYLKDYSFSHSAWIDDHRSIKSMHASRTFNDQVDNTPRVVIVDTKTGEVKETGYVGEVQCYSEGRIATHNIGFDYLFKNEASYFGKLGEPLQVYRQWFPRDMELNIPSCQLVPRLKRPQYPDMLFPLKVEHGVLYQVRPKDFPVLELGVGTNNRPALIRKGADAVKPLQVYWEQPSGRRIDIPVNPGEEITSVSYIPFEDAYLLNIDLTNTQPIKVWEPRFIRLLYLDGTIKRFSVPTPIMELIKANKASATAVYTKRGMAWHLSIGSRNPDLEHLDGNYLVIGKELVKIPASGMPSTDGCKLYGSNPSAYSTKEKMLRDMYFIDICKGE